MYTIKRLPIYLTVNQNMFVLLSCCALHGLLSMTGLLEVDLAAGHLNA